MPGTKLGSIKAQATIRAKYGPNFHATIGRQGGSTPTDKLKGFAADRNRASVAGRLGGLKSRRGPAVKEELFVPYQPVPFMKRLFRKKVA